MLRLLSYFTLLVCVLSVTFVLSSIPTNLALAADDPTEILDQEAKEGFASLFDGKTLDGWIGNYKGVKAKDGMIVIEEDCSGAMLTEKKYADFILRFDFRLHPGSNNGLIIRSPQEKIPPKDGIELQILDNSAEKYATLKEYQFHGSLYAVAAAKRGFLKKVGEWNSQEVSCIGSRLKITLNGHVILNVDMNDFDPENTLGKYPVPALRHTEGHLGFLNHHDPLELRNLRVREVKKEEKEAVAESEKEKVPEKGKEAKEKAAE